MRVQVRKMTGVSNVSEISYAAATRSMQSFESAGSTTGSLAAIA